MFKNYHLLLKYKETWKFKLKWKENENENETFINEN